MSFDNIEQVLRKNVKDYKAYGLTKDEILRMVIKYSNDNDCDDDDSVSSKKSSSLMTSDDSEENSDNHHINSHRQHQKQDDNGGYYSHYIPSTPQPESNSSIKSNNSGNLGRIPFSVLEHDFEFQDLSKIPLELPDNNEDENENDCFIDVNDRAYMYYMRENAADDDNTNGYDDDKNNDITVTTDDDDDDDKSSLSTCDESQSIEYTADNTRMQQYLAPYEKNTSIKMGMDSFHNNDKKKKMKKKKYTNKKTRYTRVKRVKGIMSQSGSDVPSQSSGDDDEMVFDDEHYAQAIADWRMVLPLERTKSDHHKDEERANLRNDARTRVTRNDFLEGLLESLTPGSNSSSKLDSIDKIETKSNEGIHSISNNKFISNDDQYNAINNDQNDGARLLATASPPNTKNTSDRKLRTWEKPTTSSSLRRREKYSAPIRKIETRRKKTSFVTFSSASLCYDTSSLLNLHTQCLSKVEPVIGMTSELKHYDINTHNMIMFDAMESSEYSDDEEYTDEDNTDINSEEDEDSGKWMDGEIQFDGHEEYNDIINKDQCIPKVHISHLKGYVNQLEALVAKSSEEEAKAVAGMLDTDVVPSDLADDFMVITNTNKINLDNWSSSDSSEELEIFPQKEVKHDDFHLVHAKVTTGVTRTNGYDSTTNRSFTIEEFVAKYNKDNDEEDSSMIDNNNICDKRESSDEDDSELSHRDHGVDTEFDSKLFAFDNSTTNDILRKSTLLSHSPLYSFTNENDILNDIRTADDYSSDHLLPSNHPIIGSDELGVPSLQKHENIRVYAKLDKSIDMSGGGLPYGAFDDVSITSFPSVPPIVPNHLRVVMSESDTITSRVATLNPSSIMTTNLRNKNSSVSTKIISDREKTSFKKSFHSDNNDIISKTKNMMSNNKDNANIVRKSIGTKLLKRSLSIQSQRPGLPLLLRSVLRPVGLRSKESSRSYLPISGAYSETLNALASTAGIAK